MLLDRSISAFCLLVGLLALFGCDATSPMPEGSGETLDDLRTPEGFTYATTRAVDVTLQAADATGAPLAGVPVDFADPDGGRLATGVTGRDGALRLTLALPTDQDSLVAQPRYLGLPSEVALAITGDRADVHLGGPPPARATGPSIARASRKSSGFATLGGWDSRGVPDYLTPDRDLIDAGLLATLNASLPENAPVPSAHPEYLADGNATDVILTEEADVWVTFVHEGAGWRNALGYYTYDAAAPPTSAEEIDARTVIFPNVSFSGSGGGLVAGDKVRLGRFPAGTGIGWFLVANGWNGREVGDGYHLVFSNPAFNPEPDAALRQHNVLLRDAERELLLLAFEDVRRDDIPFRCDQDFNDAVFYVSSNPVEAIETEAVPSVTDPASDPEADVDGDGVLNGLDADPYDAGVSGELHLPAEGASGSVAFEDLWPARGDYDFNDLVADYHLTVGLDAQNRATRLDVEIAVQAIGAGYRNGLALALPIAPGAVRSVSGARLDRGVFALTSRGVESGSGSTVIPLFDDAYALVQRPGGYFVNTETDAPRVEPGRLTVRIELNVPVALDALALDALDLFLVVDGERGREVHLPGRMPTDRADASLFGTSADATDPARGRAYVTAEGLPWALHLPEAFAYPLERAPLDAGHRQFVPWARSGGAVSPDWYRDLPGHRDASHLFQR
ncbi:MAG: LruC domain-containing protein [Bacteroidota bacterium]